MLIVLHLWESHMGCTGFNAASLMIQILAREIVDRRFVIANDGVVFDCFLLT